MSLSYADFLARKRMLDPATGMNEISALPQFMKEHQRDITAWALRRGRAAIFAGTGLGKTLMELVWGSRVAAHTGKPVLCFAPLAVSAQHLREAEKFGLSAQLAKAHGDIKNGVFVANYQKIGHFDLSAFGGVILDESSILKSTDGHYRTRLIDECSIIPFRLAATATPAPNDFMELGNHAEFLGVMSYTDMLATFFVHDGGDTQKWRLKGHAENEFWKWMASWAVMIRKPSDLGYSNEGYDLPPLHQHQHTVGVEYAPSLETGLLFPMEARGLSERIAARRDTIAERVAMAVSIVLGAMECQLRKKGAPITDHTIKQTEENTSAPASSKTQLTPVVAKNMRPTKNTESGKNSLLGQDVRPLNETGDCEKNTGSRPQTMTNFCEGRLENVRSAGAAPERLESATGLPLITAMNPGGSEGFSARTVTAQSDCSEIGGMFSPERSNISTKRLEQWVIWCHLNSEQDALKKAFGDLAISIHGGQSDEEKERLHLAWLAGDAPVIICKPSMFGHGLNWQHCHNMVFVGLNDSFEQVYQSIRRCWRFGQTKPVNVHFIAAETEGAVVANIKRKEADAERMAAAMVMHTAHISSQSIRGMSRDMPDYSPKEPMKIPYWIEVAA
jgi:hypothetical protein